MKSKRHTRDLGYRNSYYNYSSEAYKYYPEYEEIQYPRRRQKTRVKTKRKPVVSRRVIFKKETKANIADQFKTCVAISLVFAFSLALLCSFASTTAKREEINILTSNLKQLNESNSNLQSELQKNIDLNKIEKVASTKLGMQKPANHQIVYINVPKQSYTVQYNVNSDTIANSKKSVSLIEIFNSLFRG